MILTINLFVDRSSRITPYIGVGSIPNPEYRKEKKIIDVSLARLRGTVGGEPDSDE